MREYSARVLRMFSSLEKMCVLLVYDIYHPNLDSGDTVKWDA